MNWRRWLAGLLVPALLLAGGCSFRTKYGDTFRFPLGAEPVQLDPQMAADAASVTVLRSLMEGLTVLDAQGKPQPAVAEAWNHTNEGRSWTFVLRECTWSNKTPVTAADFVYAWNRATDGSIGSPLSARFANIHSVRAEGDRVLRVTLKQADAAFDAAVADTAFFPCNRAFFEQTQGHYGMDAEHVLSNGAFTLAAWEHHSYVSMHRNEEYYAVKQVAPEAVRYVIGRPSDPVTALAENELDAAELTAEQAIEAEKSGLPVIGMNDSLCALWFNTSVKSLANAAVRRALRDSVEWDLLKDSLALQNAVAGQVDFVPPDAVWGDGGYREAAGTVGYTMTDNATAALRKAALPTLTVLCTDDEATLQAARLILQSWQKHADLYFSLKPLAADELAARMAVGNYEIAIGAVTGGSADARRLLAAYTSSDADNVTRLQNAALAQQIAAADSTAELTACEAKLHELCPCVPLWYAARAYATGKGVEGLTIRPFNGDPIGAVYDFINAEK
ncbi:MAG: hypothetical protein IJC17_00245 [Clostridia bacterium]|nr:hypothetical protein [Clostridia bacterium]